MAADGRPEAEKGEKEGSGVKLSNQFGLYGIQ